MTPRLVERLQKLIPMLGSDRDGEVLATVHAIGNSLRSEKHDWHDLAARLSAAGMSISDVLDRAAANAAKAWDSARAADLHEAMQRDEERRRHEAERAQRAAAYAAEKAARAAARQTPEYKARMAELRRQARAKRAVEREHAEAERAKEERIRSHGPRWDDIGDAVRRAWVKQILSDPLATLSPSTVAALNAIDAALAPKYIRGRTKPTTGSDVINQDWIVAFENAARDYTIRRETRQ